MPAMGLILFFDPVCERPYDTETLRRQAMGGTEATVVRVADALGAPVVKALLGKAVLPDDSPYTTGYLGLIGTAPSDKAMENCDTLLLIGTPKTGSVVCAASMPGR